MRLVNFHDGGFYNADCLDAMARLPAGCVDMILADLPYGTTQNKWGSVIPFESLWREYWRVLKRNGAVVLTASQPFTTTVVASAIEHFRYSWIWEKSSATGHLNAKKMPMKLHEDILVFSSDVHTYNPQGLVPFNKKVRRGSNGANFGKSGTENLQEFTGYPRSIISFATDADRFHPTQKPVALFEYLIRTYTNPGEIVLDNTAGSGTTAVAARNTGRRWICMERDPTYFERAIERICGTQFAYGVAA